MLRTIFLSAALALGATSIGNAAILPLPIDAGDAGIVRVAEGCGPGFARGPGGHCHPMMVMPHRACPRGFHLGPEHRRCLPN